MDLKHPGILHAWILSMKPGNFKGFYKLLIFCDGPAKAHRNICCVCDREGMWENLSSREFPILVSLNNPYPPRQGMSFLFLIYFFFNANSIFFYDLLHYLFWTGFSICSALSKCGACLELPEGESGCELPPHLSWTERERSRLAGRGIFPPPSSWFCCQQGKLEVAHELWS